MHTIAKIGFTILLSGIGAAGHCQVGNLKENTKLLIKEEWVEGRVLLSDNTVYNGKIDFQENFDLIKVKVEEKIRTFTAKQVLEFSYYDEKEGGDKFFISILYDLEKNQRENWMFFEVLKETSDLALLSRRIYFQKEIPGSGISDSPQILSTPYGSVTIPGNVTPGSGPSTVEIEKEVLFFANDAGIIEEYAEITYKRRSPKKTKILNKSLLQDFMGSRYEECSDFVEKNKLNLKKKDDLVSLLSFYGSL